MIQFTYKLKLNERVRGKVQSAIPATTQRRTPSATNIGKNLHRSRLELDRAVREFLRHATPWIKYRRPREPRTRMTITADDPPWPI